MDYVARVPYQEMAKHYNPRITEDAARLLKPKGADFLSDNVQGPVATIAIRPKLKTAFNSATGTGATILTASSEKETYIVGCALSYVKDATSTGTDFRIGCVIDNATSRLISLPGITLTAASLATATSFQEPVLIDKGSAVTINCNTGVANQLYVGTIYYYEV